MSSANKVKFALKVVTNKQKTKVIYAEADTDFIDVLLSFLTLPLGTIVRILGKHEAPAVGSLSTLYNSLSNLNSDVCLYYDSCKCDWYYGFVSGVFTKTRGSFIISDDLQIFPSETRYAIRILTGQGITGTEGTELMDVSFGLNEVMDLLKGSLLSQTPLTDLILNKGKLTSVSVKYDSCVYGQHNSRDEKISTVKAIMQESTKRILLVESHGDFVHFLFTLFTIPLGAVECLLGGSTTLKNIDNLYRSLKNINDYKNLLEHRYYLGGELFPSVLFPKGRGNFVYGQRMYMVTDDLTVTPLCTTSSLSIFNRLKVPLSDIKELELDIGLNEALSILKASLTSTSALSDGLKNKLTSTK